MGLSPPIISDIFSLSENSSYNLRSDVTVNRRSIRTSKLVLRPLVQSEQFSGMTYQLSYKF